MQNCPSGISSVKVAVADIRYFAGSKFSVSLVHYKNFSSMWQVIFKLYVFAKIPLLSLNEHRVKSQATIIIVKFVNKP